MAVKVSSCRNGQQRAARGMATSLRCSEQSCHWAWCQPVVRWLYPPLRAHPLPWSGAEARWKGLQPQWGFVAGLGHGSELSPRYPKRTTAQLPAPFSYRPPTNDKKKRNLSPLNHPPLNSSPLSHPPFRSEVALMRPAPEEGGGPEGACEWQEQPQTPRGAAAEGSSPLNATETPSTRGQPAGRSRVAGVLAALPHQRHRFPIASSNSHRPQRDVVSSSPGVVLHAGRCGAGACQAPREGGTSLHSRGRPRNQSGSRRARWQPVRSRTWKEPGANPRRLTAADSAEEDVVFHLTYIW